MQPSLSIRCSREVEASENSHTTEYSYYKPLVYTALEYTVNEHTAHPQNMQKNTGWVSGAVNHEHGVIP